MISPIYIRVGVQTSLVIPTIDGDNDQVRCRFASTATECADVCPPSSLPNGTVIIASNCTLIITGAKANDWYAVAVQVDACLSFIRAVRTDAFENLDRRLRQYEFDHSIELCTRSIPHQCLREAHVHHRTRSLRSVQSNGHVSKSTSRTTTHDDTLRDQLLYSLQRDDQRYRHAVVPDRDQGKSDSTVADLGFRYVDLDSNC